MSEHMSDPKGPNTPIDDVVKEIRLRLKHEQNGAIGDEARPKPAASELVFRIQELLSGDNKTFVENLYRQFLLREPDANGLRECLRRLEEGESDRVALLREIVRSEEAVMLGARLAPEHGRASAGGASMIPPQTGMPTAEAFHQEPIDPGRTEYAAKELVSVPPEIFLRNAYRQILKREPDEGGYKNYSDLLESGRTLPYDVILQISRSPEARQLGTRVSGLWKTTLKRACSRLPFLGSFAEILAHLFYLPDIVRQWKETGRESRAQFQATEAAIRRQARNIDAAIALATQELNRELLAKVETLQILVSMMEADKLDRNEVREATANLADREWVETYVAGRLSEKPGWAAFNEALAAKADETAIRDLEDRKANAEEVVSRHACEARHDEIASRIAGKVDQSLFERALNSKADRDELASGLAAKGDLVALEALAGGKADRQEIAALDARKADRDELATALAAKGDLVALEALAAGKADRREIAALDARKPDRDELASGLAAKGDLVALEALAAGKADRREIAALDARKPDRDELASGLAAKGDLVALEALAGGKADRQEIAALDARKADRDELATALAAKGDLVALEALAGGKADRREIAALDARKVDRDELATGLAAKGDLDILQQVIEDKVDGRDFVAALLKKAGVDVVSAISDRQRGTLSEMHSQKLRLLDMERRLSLLLAEARKRMPEPFDGAQVTAILKAAGDSHDAMYVDFEDLYRGTREDIKARQQIYVPYLKEQLAKGRGKRALDLGCGRGEFLEILSESGYEAAGIDANSIMVSRCQELALPVDHADAIEYLKSRTASSYGVISAFHLVEHLPTDGLLMMLDEALRALRPGGLLILETPNPRNIVVGSCTFYFDPTHLHPIPAELLRFQVEARGFVNSEVKPLHPVPDYARPPANEIPERLAELLYGPQDYGLIAWKS